MERREIITFVLVALFVASWPLLVIGAAYVGAWAGLWLGGTI